MSRELRRPILHAGAPPGAAARASERHTAAHTPADRFRVPGLPVSRTHLMQSPQRADGAAIYQLIGQCPPLDLNSLYAYLLLCEHHAATCVVARHGAQLDGFVSAYRLPQQPETLFVWQVAVHARARGTRLARRMLAHLLARPALADVRYLETTISPDNQASRRTFAGLAESLCAPCAERPLFDAAAFGEASHEDERLLRFGPLRLPFRH